jgi:hypothetical protein
VESVSGLLARTGPRGSQMAPRRPFGVTFGPPGEDRAQRAPDGSQEAVWSHFWVSWRGPGPEGPRWLPGDRLESHLGLLARTRPRGPQMSPRRPCGVTFGPSGLHPAQRAPDESQEALWSQFLVPGTVRFQGTNITPNYGSALHGGKDVVESKVI